MRNWAILIASMILFVAVASLGSHHFWGKFNFWVSLIPMATAITSIIGIWFSLGPLGNDIAKAIKNEKTKPFVIKQPWGS